MKPTVYICAGSSCRKRKGNAKKLLVALEPVASIRRVKCQKICKGPVVGVRRGPEIEWFRNCRDKGDGDDLARVAKGDKPSKALRKKIASKRSGKLR